MRASPYVTLAALLVAGSLPVQEAASTTAAVPAEMLARLTAPPALEDGPAGLSRGAEGVVLLDEEILAVGPAGQSTVLIHRVLRPLARGGTWRASKIVTLFRSRSEDVALVGGSRRTAAGETIPLAAEAAFVETPQPLAEEHVYTDLAQLVLLFPGVRAGDTVEYTLVKRGRTDLDEDFSDFLPVADPWPVVRARRVLLLAAGPASRLRAVPMGLDGVKERREALASGTTAVSWSVDALPALRLERKRQPIRQGGPGIWLSTVASWTEVAAWYGGMVEAAGTLGPDLERSVAAWTGGLSAPREIVAALQHRVALRVHYLGLEFGARSVRPRGAAEVWSSGFGDCKEIASLLRAMLSSCGVRSHLVLVNTQHAGMIETSIPSHRQFDHAILALEEPGGGLAYFDPAAPGVGPGELPPGVGGRTALLVARTGGRLVQLPEAPAGRLRLDYDLTFVPPDHVQGWLRAGADAYQGRLLLARIRHSSAQEGADLGPLLADFFTEVEVIETGPEEAAESVLPSTATLFFRAPVSCEPAGAGLRVPASEVLLPPFGVEERRETPHYQHLGSVTVAVRYAVPPGWEVTEALPAPLELESSGLRVEARWVRSPGELRGLMRYETTRTVVEPAGYVGCVRAVRSLRAWLERPVALGRVETEAVPGPPPALPRLATGAAQLKLVDEMFSREGAPEPRRAALEEVREWFAGDPATAFEAGLEIAVIDQEQGRNAASVDDLRALLARFGASVSAELRGWGEYLLAGGLRRCGSGGEAQALYDRLSRDPELPAARRGWAYARAASMRLDSAPLEAVAVLDEAVRTESPALEQQVALLAELDLAGVPGADLDRRLDEIGARFPHRVLDVHARLLHQVRDLLDHGDFSGAAGLAGALDRRVSRRPELRTLAAPVREARRLVRRGTACHEVAGEMGDAIAAYPPGWWHTLPVPANGRDALVAALQRLDRMGGGREFVRGTFALLTHWSVAPDFFEFLLRRSAEHLRRAGDGGELADRIDVWCARLRSAATTDTEDREVRQ